VGGQAGNKKSDCPNLREEGGLLLLREKINDGRTCARFVGGVRIWVNSRTQRSDRQLQRGNVIMSKIRCSRSTSAGGYQQGGGEQIKTETDRSLESI